MDCTDYYRCNPNMFFDLSVQNRELLITAVCGPRDNFVFDKSQCYISCMDLMPSLINSSGLNWSNVTRNNVFSLIVNEFIDNVDYVQAGMFMQFFKIQTIVLDFELDKSDLQTFTRVFPFGCFAQDASFCSAYRNTAHEWCFGFVNVEIVCDMLRSKFDAAQVNFLLGKIEESTYGVNEMDVILLEIFQRPANDFKKPLLDILSQKRLKYKTDATSLRPYPYLIDGGPNWNVPKPRWSRSRHARISLPQFSREVLVVLQMHKFRRDEFPLHKDLVDLLLTKLFERHLTSLEERIMKRKSLYEKLTHPNADDREVRRFCLRQGISIEPWLHWDRISWTLEAIQDAVDFSLGLTIPKGRRIARAEDLKRTIVHHMSKWFTHGSIQEDPDKIFATVKKFCETNTGGIDYAYLVMEDYDWNDLVGSFLPPVGS